MSYLTIATAQADADLARRVTAAVAAEQRDTQTIPADLFWFVSSRGDVEAAYAAALASGNARPGADEAAVTDGMILSAVQAFPNWPAP